MARGSVSVSCGASVVRARAALTMLLRVRNMPAPPKRAPPRFVATLVALARTKKLPLADRNPFMLNPTICVVHTANPAFLDGLPRATCARSK